MFRFLKERKINKRSKELETHFSDMRTAVNTMEQSLKEVNQITDLEERDTKIRLCARLYQEYLVQDLNELFSENWEQIWKN